MPPVDDVVAAAQEVLADRGYTRMSGTHNRFRTTWIPPDTPAVPRSLSLTHAGDPYSVDLHGSVDRDFQGGMIVPLSRLARPADRRLDALEWGAGRTIVHLLAKRPAAVLADWRATLTTLIAFGPTLWLGYGSIE